MRLASREINSCLKNGPGPRANFGLIFNKWLDYNQTGNAIEPTVARNRGPLADAARQVKSAASEVLKRHHTRQARYCRAVEKAGWTPFIFHARLVTPFVSGLGMTHPTETGLVLDHTSGMPYIPAAGQKGVLRIAHMVNSLQDDNGNWLEPEQLREQGIIEIRDDGTMHWLEDQASRVLFGSTDSRQGLAGQLTFLDSYPLQPPELTEEILNPHYNDYYKGNRGPTEDQNPMPVKFLVVKPGTEFVFRLLLRLPYSRSKSFCSPERLSALVEQNVVQSLTGEGIGAKTSLGFGRFEIVQQGTEPQLVDQWMTEEDEVVFPWRTVIRRVESVTSWGDFRQKVLDAEIDEKWRARLDVGQAVERAAQRAQKDNPGKWTDERDRMVAGWLQPSGVKWQPMAKKSRPAAPPQKDNSGLLARINAFSEDVDRGWKEFKAAKIRINKLDKQCCVALKAKFSTWKLKKSKKKSAERKTYDNLNKQLKKLS